MPSWREVEAEVPEFAALARAFFDAHAHKTLATLRRDGSPRISGSEVDFAEGELWLGSMWRSLKALDLRRDPRFALHSGSAAPPNWTGDAKVAGRVEEVTDPELITAINGEGAPPSVPPTSSAPTSLSMSSSASGPARPYRHRVMACGPRRRAPRAPLAPDAAAVRDRV